TDVTNLQCIYRFLRGEPVEGSGGDARRAAAPHMRALCRNEVADSGLNAGWDGVMQTEGKPEAPARRLPWRGLGAWNLYFLAKLGLLWAGVLNFHPLPNIAFAAGLLLPLPGKWLPRLRQAVAIPI